MSEIDRNDDIERILQLAGRRPAVPDDLAMRVRASLHDVWRQEVDARRMRRRFLYAAPLAAAAAITLFFVLMPARQTAPPAAIPVRIATIERTIGDVRCGTIVAGAALASGDGRAAIRMSDGTSVRVDAQTRLRFDDVRRLALERGAIYVDTAHSGLTVRTPFGMVRDVGTKFEVRIGETTARIRVRDGEVALGDHHAHRGEQLDVTTSGSVAMTRIDTWGQEWQWLNEITPPFAVDGKRVTDFLMWFAGESGMEVRYDSAATKTRAAGAVLHGSIGTLVPAAAANAVLPTAGLRGDVKNGVITVHQQ